MKNFNIEIANGQLVVDSRLVAEELGIEHRSFYRTIKNYQSDIEDSFGQLRPGIATVENAVKAVNNASFFYLTEDQATFLMTLSRNSPKVVDCKKNLVKAFSEAKRLLNQQQQQPQPKDLATLAETVIHVIDIAFKNVDINPSLVAGCKLNAAEKVLPPEARAAIEEGRKLLSSTTTIPDRLLTATELGQQMGISARAVNKLLIEKGLQCKNPEKKSKGSAAYLPTERGHEFCDFTIATGRGKDNTSFQTLKWYPSVAQVLNT